MPHPDNRGQSDGFLRKRRRYFRPNAVSLYDEKASLSFAQLANLDAFYQCCATWFHDSETTLTGDMDSLRKRLSLKVGRKKHLQAEGGLLNLQHNQPTIKNVSDSSLTSTSSFSNTSTAIVTEVSTRSSQPKHTRHYTIGTQLDGSKPDQLPGRTVNVPHPEPAETRGTVTLSRRLHRTNEPNSDVDTQLFTGFEYFSRKHTVSSTEPHQIQRTQWRAEDDSLIRDLQNAKLMEDLKPSISRSSSLRVAYKPHRYPPSSYRDPFAFADDGGLPIHHRQRVKPEIRHSVPFQNANSDEDGKPTDASIAQEQPHMIPQKSSRASRDVTTHLQQPQSHSSSSINHTPTYFSSDVPSEPSRILRTRRRARSHSPGSSSQTSSSQILPDPEEVYTNEIHHFTDCPHTSPPSHRPLNSQPYLTAFRPGLLMFPPLHIRAQRHVQHGAAPLISVIAGSCAQCEWKSRRDAETTILDRYVEERTWLENHTAWIDGVEDRMLALKKLEWARDAEVKRVWQGYAQRWVGSSTSNGVNSDNFLGSWSYRYKPRHSQARKYESAYESTQKRKSQRELGHQWPD